jgi:hypothetical protein
MLELRLVAAQVAARAETTITLVQKLPALELLGRVMLVVPGGKVVPPPQAVVAEVQVPLGELGQPLLGAMVDQAPPHQSRVLL